MPSLKRIGARTTGSAHFDLDEFFERWVKESESLLPKDDFRSSIIAAFNLAQSDSYVYHAIASVSLARVQEAIDKREKNGLHAWYLDNTDNPSNSPPPSASDIAAYTSVFASTTSTAKALTGLAANAKKNSHRAGVAAHLQAMRILPSPPYTVPKTRKPHANPYYDYWAWSCRNLEWAGPTPDTVRVKQSHHILPVLMHHFGCVCPSYESLEVIKQSARGRKVLELGSGNGYWTYMLRRMGVAVDAVDNLQSEYRTLWIGDTVVQDGDRYLKDNGGAKDALLLLVYPIVSFDFTARVFSAYAGDTVCVAGTQNRNGYTAFKDKVIDEYVATESPHFKKAVQIPLPSFAGKDDALFVFEKDGKANA
ncbi:MAG: hypothetical protein LQ342_006490 [Letrouitia transgressa]|nr:MAG: hypothetical protein LQ342_006490 [Letrouitia transgressa]